MEMCRNLSTGPGKISDYLNDSRGLCEDRIKQHYIVEFKKNEQLYDDLTLATYRRVATEPSFTRGRAAFILGLPLTTSHDRYKNYVEMNQGNSTVRV